MFSSQLHALCRNRISIFHPFLFPSCINVFGAPACTSNWKRTSAERYRPVLILLDLGTYACQVPVHACAHRKGANCTATKCLQGTSGGSRYFLGGAAAVREIAAASPQLLMPQTDGSALSPCQSSYLCLAALPPAAAAVLCSRPSFSAARFPLHAQLPLATRHHTF